MWSSMDTAFLSKKKYSFALLEAQHITQEKKLGYFVRVILDNILPKGVTLSCVRWKTLKQQLKAKSIEINS